jgi:Ni/Co efflux regulator RcnB
MKTLLSVIVAAAFAATSFNVAAQTKVPTTKGGGEVKTKDGASVGRKEMKDKPKNEAPQIKVEKREPKKKAEPTKVQTKGGGEVKSKDGAVNKK